MFFPLLIQKYKKFFIEILGYFENDEGLKFSNDFEKVQKAKVYLDNLEKIIECVKKLKGNTRGFKL